MELVGALLGGRRGRRLLLEFALESEAILLKGQAELPLHGGIFYASYREDVARGEAVSLFGPGAEEGRKIIVTAEDVAELLAATALAPVTAGLLCEALARSVDTARYWQPPEGTDVIAGSAPVRAQLARVAQHLAASGLAAWWMRTAATGDQWHVEWEQADAPGRWAPSGEPAATVLASWRKAAEIEEARAAVERPVDPAANYGGEWWSMPPAQLLHSTGTFFDGSPVGLWCVEDGFGWDRAIARRVEVPASVRIFEITDASDWAQLCRSFPLEVTAQKRHDWYRTTGRVGSWVMPDFSRLAADYDGVHLGVAAYLAMAGEVIEVDAERASVMAGWNPDGTRWLTDGVALRDEEVAWECADANSGNATWTRAAQGS
ncbi:hypothetical protein DQ353_14365 [Arthrobacter sp. AQ5-05]|uniref:hypothetical protein n=1 Tax=Arthrobacter sp. AQ5-05 TaxID=2184581 RepID=UPI000DCEBE01|nr:hypothetical protein [Arthrobacter sp. AQ5-05]RAX48553.1 hypothetical protein DQ353_14365 [Arthrobacter sp. AQ5-05]